MGNSISLLKPAIKLNNKHFIDLSAMPLNELVEYHCKFRTWCSRFVLNRQDFHKVFHSRLSFDLWDRNKVELVDVLEIFSGIIILLNIPFEDKVKFLFDLYDFNDMNSLSDIDVQLMIKSIISALLKIFVVLDEPDVDEIVKMVSRLTKSKKRINFSQLLMFLKDSSEVSELFVILKKEYPCLNKLNEIQEARFKEDPKNTIPEFLRTNGEALDHRTDFNHGGYLINSRQNKSKIKVLSSFASSQITKEQQTLPLRSSKLTLNWVYGFSCDTSIRSFVVKTAKPEDNKNFHANNKLIYSVSNIIVIYYYKYKKQAHYTEHTNEICAISISKSGKLCASGQKGTHPKVLVWETDSLKTVATIHMNNQSKAYLIEFVNNDKYLVILFKRPNPSIQIYNLETVELVTSTYLKQFIIWLEPIKDLSGCLLNTPKRQTYYKGWNINASFVCFSEFKIYIFAYLEEEDYNDYIVTSFDAFPNKIISEDPVPPKITGGVALYANKLNPESVIYKSENNFDIICYYSTNKGQIFKVENLLNDVSEVNTVCLYQIQKTSSFVALIYFKEQLLAGLTQDHEIFIIDMMSMTSVGTIDIKQTNLPLKSMEIKNVERGDNGKLFFSTWKGDLFYISFYEKRVWNKALELNLQKAKKFNTIFKIEKGYNSLCLVERDRKDKSIYMSGSKNLVQGFSTISRELIDSCTFEDKITCMDCFTQPIGGIVFAFGTKQGRIWIRFDCEIIPRHFKFDKSIKVLKFSESGAHLIAGTTEPSIFLFTYHNGTYFHDPFKIMLNKEIPVSINFCVNLNEFILGTHLLKYYHIKITDFRERKLPEMFNIENAKCNLIQSKYVTEKGKKKTPFIVFPDLGMIIIGEVEGVISIYNSVTNLKENCATFYYGHSSNISGLKMSRFKDKLYSIAKNDGSLFEWNVEAFPTLLMSIANCTESKQISSCQQEGAIYAIKRQIIANSIVKHRPTIVHDSFGYFRGFSHNYLRKIFGEKFSLFDESENLNKRYPPFSLKLGYVYGYDAYNYRNNVLYLHCHMEKKTKTNDQFAKSSNYDDNRNQCSGSNKFIREKRFYNFASKLINVYSVTRRAKKNPFVHIGPHLQVDDQNMKGKEKQFDDQDPKNNTEKIILSNDKENVYSQHFGCKNISVLTDSNKDSEWMDSAIITCPLNEAECYRKIIYFVSRIVVIINPLDSKKTQKFYQGHTAKISSITVHPSKSIVASGETAYQPKIHVWEMESCSTWAIIDTFHKLGIMCLKFTHDKSMIISASVDSCSSIQVTDWHSATIIAFRNTFSEKIIDLVVDAHDAHKFVTANSQRIDFWYISGSSIINSHFIDFDATNLRCSFTNMIYMNYWSRNVLQKDLLVTTSDGQLIIVRNGKFLKCIQLKTNYDQTDYEAKNMDQETIEDTLVTYRTDKNDLSSSKNQLAAFKKKHMTQDLQVSKDQPNHKNQNSESELYVNTATISQQNLSQQPNLVSTKTYSSIIQSDKNLNENRPELLAKNSSIEDPQAAQQSSKIRKENSAMSINQSMDVQKSQNDLPSNPNVNFSKDHLAYKTLEIDNNIDSRMSNNNLSDTKQNDVYKQNDYSEDDNKNDHDTSDVHKNLPKFKKQTYKITLIKMFIISSQTFIFIGTDHNLIQIYNLNFELVAEIEVFQPSETGDNQHDGSNKLYDNHLGYPDNNKTGATKQNKNSKIKTKISHGNQHNELLANTNNSQTKHFNAVKNSSRFSNQSNQIYAEVQSLDFYLTGNNLLLLVSLSIGKIVEIMLEVVFVKDPYNINSRIVAFKRENVETIVECHASQNFTNLNNDFDFIHHKRIYLTVNPSHDVIATCGEDEYLRFWDYETKALLFSKKLNKIPTCIKFSPSGKILVIGLQNGHVIVLEPEIKRIGSKIRLRLDMPEQDIDPMFKTTSHSHDKSGMEKPVLNVEFSSNGDLLAVAHDNNKLNDKKDNLKDRGTAIVIVYVSKDSPLKEQAIQSDQNKYFIKYAEVKLASLNYADTSKMSYLGMASYFMAFSDDDTYLMLYYQSINEHHIRENHDKEGKYVIWNFKSRSSEINREILKQVHFKNNNFPNHIYGINSYTITDKLESSISFMKRARLGDELIDNQIVLSSISNYDKICFLGSDNGEIFISKKNLFALKQDDSPENLPRSNFCQAKRYRAHSSFVNQIEISPSGKKLFTTGISDECIFQWEVIKIEEKNDLDHLPNKDVHAIEEQNNRCFYEERPSNTIQKTKNDLIIELPTLKEVDEDKYELSHRTNTQDIVNRKEATNTLYSEDSNFSKRQNQTGNPKLNDEKKGSSPFEVKESGVKIYYTKEHDKKLNYNHFYDTKERFDSNIAEIYPSRKRIINLQQQIDYSLFPLYRLRLEKVIGRNSMKTRANLAVVLNKFLIYSAGTSLIITELFRKHQTKVAKELKSMAPPNHAEKKPMFLQANTLQIEQPLNDQTENANPNKPKLSQSASVVISHRRSLVPYKSRSFETQDHPNDKNEHQKFSQNILFAGQRFNDNYPSEIACFQLAPDERTICVGTNDICSSLLLWEITSNTLISSITLTNCISPQFIRFSADMKAIIVLGLVQNYNSCMYYVDIHNHKILAMLDLIHSPTSKIWDASFIPDRNDQFISVGLVHASLWEYRAEVLEFRELKMESPVLLEETKKQGFYEQNNTEENLITCFFIIKFLTNKIFITACSKGFVYIWKKQEIQIQHSVYSNSPVSAIAQHPNNIYEFFTGGFQMPLHYYQIKYDKQTKTIIKLYEIDIFNNLSLINMNTSYNKMNDKIGSHPEFQIQSLIFAATDHIIYGTRNGNIGEFYLPSDFGQMATLKAESENTKKDAKENKNKTDSINPLYNQIFLSVADNHIPRVADFSFDRSLIFCVSEKGLFTVYDFATLNNVWKHDFDLLTLDMIILKNSVILVFESSIITLILDNNQYKHNEEITQFITKARLINKVKVHLKYEFLAIAFHGQKENPPMIEIYSIESIYEKLHTIQTEEIEVMDFSCETSGKKNCCLLMTQDVSGKKYVYEIEKDRLKVDNDDNIEWSSEGLIIASSCKMLKKYFSDSNPIISILKIDDNTIVVSDLLGTVV